MSIADEGGAQGGAAPATAAPRRPGLVAEVTHGRKVNQLCGLELSPGRTGVAVAAVSKFVTLYALQAAAGKDARADDEGEGC
jgi:hypothetical protein